MANARYDDFDSTPSPENGPSAATQEFLDMFADDSFFNLGSDDQSHKRKRDSYENENHYSDNTKSQRVEVSSPNTLSDEAAADELRSARNVIAQLQEYNQQLMKLVIDSNNIKDNALHRTEIFRAQARLVIIENKEQALKISALEKELAELRQKPQEASSTEKTDSIYESSAVLLPPKRKHAPSKGIDPKFILTEKRERTVPNKW